MKFNYTHGILLFCAVVSAVSETLAHYEMAGNPMPFHVAAGTLLAISTVLGTFSKSALPPSPPAAP